MEIVYYPMFIDQSKAS